jgi:hypothetical protein
LIVVVAVRVVSRVNYLVQVRNVQRLGDNFQAAAAGISLPYPLALNLNCLCASHAQVNNQHPRHGMLMSTAEFKDWRRSGYFKDGSDDLWSTAVKDVVSLFGIQPPRYFCMFTSSPVFN